MEKCAPFLGSVPPADLSVANGPVGQDELRDVLPALPTLSDEVLQTSHDSFMAEGIHTSVTIQGWLSSARRSLELGSSWTRRIETMQPQGAAEVVIGRRPAFGEQRE